MRTSSQTPGNKPTKKNNIAILYSGTLVFILYFDLRFIVYHACVMCVVQLKILLYLMGLLCWHLCTGRPVCQTISRVICFTLPSSHVVKYVLEQISSFYCQSFAFFL